MHVHYSWMEGLELSDANSSIIPKTKERHF